MFIESNEKDKSQKRQKKNVYNKNIKLYSSVSGGGGGREGGAENDEIICRIFDRM